MTAAERRKLSMLIVELAVRPQGPRRRAEMKALYNGGGTDYDRGGRRPSTPTSAMLAGIALEDQAGATWFVRSPEAVAAELEAQMRARAEAAGEDDDGAPPAPAPAPASARPLEPARRARPLEEGHRPQTVRDVPQLASALRPDRGRHRRAAAPRRR